MGPAHTHTALDFPAPSAARREGWRPLALTFIALAGLLCLWQALVAPRLPETVYHPTRFEGVVFWVGPGLGPFYAHGDVNGADLIVVGDSRAFDDIELETLRGEGFGAVARVWGPNADLADLLPSIQNARPRAVLIVASPAILGADYDPMMTVLLRRAPPELDPLSLRNGLDRWKAEELDYLMDAAPAEGDPARTFYVFKAERLVELWARRLADTVDRDGWSTGEIDRVLGDWADHRRSLSLGTFTTRRWHKQWFEPIRPDALAVGTRTMLQSRNDEQRLATEGRAIGALIALRESGVHVLAIRAPISPAVLAVEREFVADERLREVFASSGIPLLEFQERDYTLRDGSHLTWPASREFTRMVADEIRATDPGFSKR